MVITHYESLTVESVEKRVLARITPLAMVGDIPPLTHIHIAAHVFPDAQHGSSLDVVHEKFLNVLRDLEAMPSLEVEFEKASKDYQTFHYKVKIIVAPKGEAEVRKALADNDIELVDEIS